MQSAQGLCLVKRKLGLEALPLLLAQPPVSLWDSKSLSEPYSICLPVCRP